MDFDANKLHPATSKVCYLIRGVPGSGKSTLARILVEAYHTEDWYEADMWFEGPEGYKFNPKELGLAHDWCHTKFAEACRAGHHCVIVSNTFTTIAELGPYLDYAKDQGYAVQVIECKGNFQSIHNVPQTTIDRMKARWERI